MIRVKEVIIFANLAKVIFCPPPLSEIVFLTSFDCFWRDLTMKFRQIPAKENRSRSYYTSDVGQNITSENNKHDKVKTDSMCMFCKVESGQTRAPGTCYRQ